MSGTMGGNNWGYLGQLLGLGGAGGASGMTGGMSGGTQGTDPQGLYTGVQSEALPTIPGTTAQPNLVREPTTAQPAPSSPDAGTGFNWQDLNKGLQGMAQGAGQMQKAQQGATPAAPAAQSPGFHRPQGGAALPTQQGYQVQLSLPQLLAAYRGGVR